MKLSIILFGFLAVANCLTITPRSLSANDTLITADDRSPVTGPALAEDEWTLVLYTEHKKKNGGQCGGTSTKQSGAADKCLDIAKKLCADIKVTPNIGIADCTFNFRAGGGDCHNGELKKSVTVQGGRDSNSVDLSDDVKFVSVSCGLGGRKTVMEIAV
ncbi:hypothetical protein V8F33_014133 [Rhypophila sp. PSN 637]